MISFAELQPRLAGATRVDAQNWRWTHPACGGEVRIHTVGSRWDATCERCGKLREDDFTPVRGAEPKTVESSGGDAQPARVAVGRTDGATPSTGAIKTLQRAQKSGASASIEAQSAQEGGEADRHTEISVRPDNAAPAAHSTSGGRLQRAVPENPTLHANGHLNGVPAPSEWDRRQNLDQWRKSLMGVAYRLLRNDPEYADKALPAQSFLEPLTKDIEDAVEILKGTGGVLPPVDLTASDIHEECEREARLAIEDWLGARVWSVPVVQNGHQNGTVALVDEFADRHAVDAFTAYEAMKGDRREYSWEGLIREGCTAVLSGLMSSGKTTLAMNVARGWALGEMVLDRQCRQSRTLVVVSPKEYEAWADTIGFWGLKGVIFLSPSTDAHFGDHNMTVRWLDGEMSRLECRTLVLDTLFDFFGMPPNQSGDSNRIAMNEQTPLLQLIRERNYSGLMLGHAPKSEAKAVDPRDPEESFGGHTAWTAQHRMRMTVRRKAQGINAFITGKGGFGDLGILKEQMLVFDEATRLDSLGGLFSEHLAATAMPSVVETLRELGEPTSLIKIVEAMGKADKWVKAGLRAARHTNPPLIEMDGTKGKRGTKYRLTEWPIDRELF